MGGALAACLALGLAVGYSDAPALLEPEDSHMLTVSGGGAGSVLLTALDEGPH